MAKKSSRTAQSEVKRAVHKQKSGALHSGIAKKSQKQEAGHRDWIVQSSQERGKNPQKEVRTMTSLSDGYRQTSRHHDRRPCMAQVFFTAFSITSPLRR